MSLDIGIVCGRCDWLNESGEDVCASCGGDLEIVPPGVATVDGSEGGREQSETNDSGVVTVIRPLIIRSKDEQDPPDRAEERTKMEQARHYICKSCYSPIPWGHKFCGKCGAPTDFPEDAPATQYYGAMQVPGKAKLILIKGEGLDGISYHLNSTDHLSGRQQGAILFPDDPWLSPRHANFVYKDEKLFVRDEGSFNGIYCRVTEETALEPGGMFMCGEQLFRVETAEAVNEGPESDGTYFYASPCKSWAFRVIHILKGGIDGMIVHDTDGELIVGREDASINFPSDSFLDGHHAKVTCPNGQLTLTDLGSLNGTFVKVDEEREISHGDYVFLGKQLLRVEVTP